MLEGGAEEVRTASMPIASPLWKDFLWPGSSVFVGFSGGGGFFSRLADWPVEGFGLNGTL